MIEHLNTLQRAGVACVKIEGRMKKPEYVAAVTRCSRTDERFMRGGKNIVDGMQSFLLPGSVYRHSANDSEGNLMSTEQAMLAHIALYKADNKLGRLYDFSKSKA